MIAILADDLTSALDGAAPFAQRGLSARVMLRQLPLSYENMDVVSIDLNSRFLPPEQAAEKFRQMAKQLRHARIIYKTIDSTLRGNPGDETRGALTGSGRSKAIIAPAFPAAGRTTVKGHQYVDNQPLEQTAFSRDPRNPVLSGNVSECMAGLKPSCFQVYDALTDDDLDAVILSVGLNRAVIWGGSPGMAKALARAVSPPRFPLARTLYPPATRVLIAVGSVHPRNQRQLATLAAAGAALIQLPANVGDSLLLSRIEEAFTTHEMVCLVSPRTISAVSSASTFARHLALAISHCGNCFDGLVVTGGDTARQIVDALHADSLDLLGEIEPGVPFGILKLNNRQIPFSTKAGGFGTPETLLRCATYLLSPTTGNAL